MPYRFPSCNTSGRMFGLRQAGGGVNRRLCWWFDAVLEPGIQDPTPQCSVAWLGLEVKPLHLQEPRRKALLTQPL